MSSGLNIFNNTGELLIDSERQNYSLIAEGTLSITSVQGVVNFTQVAFGTPLVFVRFNSTSQYVSLDAVTSTSATFAIYGSYVTEPRYGYLERQTGTLEYKIYGVASSLSSGGNLGIQCFDSIGRLTYDSNRPVPRISEIFVNPYPLQPPNNLDRQPQTLPYPHNSGASPWMLINGTLPGYGFVFLQDSPSNTSVLLKPAFRSQADGIRMAGVASYSIGSQGRYWEDIIIPVPLMR